MILAALMVAGTATGCGAKDDTKVESTNKVATNLTKLDEDAIKDTYTGIEDMYVLEGSKDVDYLDGVLYDSSIVKGIEVDSSKVDTSKTGEYKITFSITADRIAYETFRDAFIKSETVKDKTSADKTKTDKGSAEKAKTETVKVKKDTVVVNKDEAQKLADQNKLVRTDNGETVKKSDGTEVKTEQKAPASTAVTGGNVVDASAKTEVKPETTATPTMDPEEEAKKDEAKKEEVKKDDKKEETKKPSTSGSKDNSGSTNKPSSGSNNGGSSSKPNSGSNNSNGGNSSNTEKPAHKHNWVNVTKTVNHPAETHQEDVYEDRQVKVKDAWDEQVKTGTAQECRQCGFRTTDGDAMTEHMLENGHSCHTVYTYETVHHDAVYETQRVKVGTKTVVDKAAWTETVVTGQKCSFCGETKTN
ncbi:hypothetical protein KGMB01110_21830 [Mediterraneibacter butyricigenes]|uniref:Pesticidal crystal protein Cry22Aa Ig-like domain-containing protein n=2 Tax=Mediterraneibacter butyricigenes TaxID=2316025 RepID=A0A391P2W9_9FIRM|nr:hypothetical protein KGMB01110_21830 [Mediterraneibacter butyricigenes]